MEPVFVFAIAIILAVVAAAIAARRGRAWWLFLPLTVAATIGGAILTSLASGGDDTSLKAAFILIPFGAVALSLLVRSGDDIAADEGSFRGKRKCPYCAESIRTEARKCKHCGADVEPVIR